MDNFQVPIMKKQAKIVFGSVVIQELQSCISVLSESIDGKSFQDKCDRKEFDKFTPEEKVCIQLSSIVQQAYKQAESDGMTYYQDMDSVINSSVSSSSSV